MKNDHYLSIHANYWRKKSILEYQGTLDQIYEIYQKYQDHMKLSLEVI